MSRTTMSSKSNCPPEHDGPATVQCKLFSDQVSEHLCLLRKKELDLKGCFSCEGCPMDAIMRRQLKFIKEVLGLSRDRSA